MAQPSSSPWPQHRVERAFEKVMVFEGKETDFWFFM